MKTLWLQVLLHPVSSLALSTDNRTSDEWNLPIELSDSKSRVQFAGQLVELKAEGKS